MRVDHFAYQQATRVAGFGLLLQLVIGLTMLLFGLLGRDSTLVIGSFYPLVGLIIWIVLIVVFHQHRLERLEALEEDELREARPDASIFEASREESGMAARRLRQMHKWMVPIASLLAAGLLILLSILTFVWFRRLEDEMSRTNLESAFEIGTSPGWHIAICLGFSVIAFIFSRFVAGMSKQQAWQNLRGGAGFMVGNALISLVIAIGVILTLFDNTGAMRVIAQVILVFMIAVAGEIVLNFILNLYRPRRRGEVPRPAFDSRVLSLLAAPDSIVRSINEAVNYQFGFDITSSWGYQLLIRSFAWLAVFAVVALLALSTLVVVEPDQQGVRLRFGRIVGDVRQGEAVWKLPWPIETVETYDVGLIQEIFIGPSDLSYPEVNKWSGTDDDSVKARKSFLVAAQPMSESVRRAVEGMEASSNFENSLDGATDSPGTGTTAEGGDRSSQDSLGSRFALVNADIVIRWRVKSGELVRFLNFSSDAPIPRSPMNMREKALQTIALREVSQFLAQEPMDDVLSPKGQSLLARLEQRVQGAFDQYGTGVEVVSLVIPFLQPAPDAAASFEDTSIELQNARKIIEEAKRLVAVTMAALVGDSESADEIVALIDQLRTVEKAEGTDSEAARGLRGRIEEKLIAGNAEAATLISLARARRWKIVTEAQEDTAEVRGQSAAYRAAPELFRQRLIMDVFASTLNSVRMKYVLGPDTERVNMGIEMREPDVGFNIQEYINTESGDS
ncbi:MAG: SPFH domain-containing protein [Planctomycetota bacterium]|nr:SPFH domain-containing protein [Planctomycetota bacterium]